MCVVLSLLGRKKYCRGVRFPSFARVSNLMTRSLMKSFNEGKCPGSEEPLFFKNPATATTSITKSLRQSTLSNRDASIVPSSLSLGNANSVACLAERREIARPHDRARCCRIRSRRTGSSGAACRATGAPYRRHTRRHSRSRMVREHQVRLIERA